MTVLNISADVILKKLQMHLVETHFIQMSSSSSIGQKKKKKDNRFRI